MTEVNELIDQYIMEMLVNDQGNGTVLLMDQIIREFKLLGFDREEALKYMLDRLIDTVPTQ